MYKVMSNGLVVDVLQTIKWIRFLHKFDDVIVTDKTSADGFYGSDNKTIYRLEGKYCPPNKTYKLGTLVAINQSEYQELASQLLTTNWKGVDLDKLTQIRNSKISQLSAACNAEICKGIRIKLSDQLYHSFSLSTEDQQNINSLYLSVLEGATKGLYHEDGKLCQYFTDSDIRLLFKAVQKHIKYHTTYFNLLKTRILEMTSPAEIQSLYYGVDLVDLHLDGDRLKLMEDIING